VDQALKESWCDCASKTLAALGIGGANNSGSQKFLKEDPVANISEELIFSFWKLNVAARGRRVPFIVAISVSAFILALAWRLTQ